MEAHTEQPERVDIYSAGLTLYLREKLAKGENYSLVFLFLRIDTIRYNMDGEDSTERKSCELFFHVRDLIILIKKIKHKEWKFTFFLLSFDKISQSFKTL